MLFKVPSLSKFSETIFTLMEFLVKVKAAVAFEITTLAKTFLTFPLIRLLLCLSLDIYIHGTTLYFSTS